MHQLPRPSSKAAPRPAPSRPNDRAAAESGDRNRASQPRMSADAPGRAGGEALVGPSRSLAGHSKEAMAKMNQIVQNYFIKAALIIVHSRMTCPPSYNKGTGVKRVNKWFNVEIDETDIFREDWRTWKTCDAEANRPPPMIIETYLDMTALTKNQSLVLIDDQGQRWSVEEMLNASPKSSLRPSSSSAAASSTSRVVLERWTIDLGPAPVEQPADLNTLLPVVYKKSIVLFRSLYTYSKFLPAWKFARQNSKPRQLHRALKVNCRIVDRGALDASLSSHVDGLTSPLSTGSSLGRVTDEFSFGATESPAGPFSVTVAYRTNCEFRVDDAEALLSSQLMGVDDGLFRPSLGMQDDRLAGRAVSAKGLGSLPSERREAVELPDRSQAYGSLSSFHQAGPPMASSPLSALRAARDLNPESASSSPPNRALPHVRSAHSSKSSLRSVEGPPPSGVQRRPSVSFMPFKTPSLSASPSQANPLAPLSPRNSLGRTPLVSALTQARNRTSLEVQPSLSGRGPSSIPETSAASSGSASPRPASVSRYSSSFGHRRGRPSSGGVSKPDDENNSSSGRASQTSSQAQPGSGILAEGGGGSGSGGGGGGSGGGGTAGSSGSIPTDDDNISDLLKLLDSKRTLKSFESTGNPAGAAADASTKRTNAALSRFQKMRDSHAALSDSLSSSFMLQRSSSTSSRQLSSVPPMVAGTSMSPSSSPGKPNSPHTPHTPAVPSRLSAQSVAVYAGGPDDARECAAAAIDRDERRRRPREVRHEETESARRTGAIDIPRSPRPLRAHNRRSSSVSQRNRALAIEDETGDLLPYGMRSASLGAQERPPLSLSALLGLQDPSDGDGAGSPADESRPASASASARAQRPDLQGEPMSRQSSSSSQPPTAIRAAASARRSSSSHHRPHHHATQRGGRRGSTSPQRGYAGDSGTPDRPAYSFSRPGGYDEDEPLLFAMSEIGGHSSRRSLEDGRAGATAAEGNSGRHAQPSSLSSSPPPSSSTPPPLPPPPPLSSSSSRSSSRPSHQNRSVYQR